VRRGGEGRAEGGTPGVEVSVTVGVGGEVIREGKEVLAMRGEGIGAQVWISIRSRGRGSPSVADVALDKWLFLRGPNP
jgi:hypothetical protein